MAKNNSTPKVSEVVKDVNKETKEMETKLQTLTSGKLSVFKETDSSIVLFLQQTAEGYDPANDQSNSNKYQTYGAVQALLAHLQGRLNGHSTLLLTAPLSKFANPNANGAAGYVDAGHDGTPFTFEYEGITYSVNVDLKDVPDIGWKKLWFGDQLGQLNAGQHITSADPKTRRKAYTAKAMRAILSGANVSISLRGDWYQVGVEMKDNLIPAVNANDTAAVAVSMEKIDTIITSIFTNERQFSATKQAVIAQNVQTQATSQQVLSEFDFTLNLEQGGKVNLATVAMSRIVLVAENGITVRRYPTSVQEKQATVAFAREHGMKVQSYS